MSSTTISIQYCGNIFTIESEPYETKEETYTRAWYILKNLGKYSYDALYSFSIIEMNKKKGMIYDL